MIQVTLVFDPTLFFVKQVKCKGTRLFCIESESFFKMSVWLFCDRFLRVCPWILLLKSQSLVVEHSGLIFLSCRVNDFLRLFRDFLIDGRCIITFWISWWIKDLWGTKVMYCFVLKLLFLITQSYIFEWNIKNCQ